MQSKLLCIAIFFFSLTHTMEHRIRHPEEQDVQVFCQQTFCPSPRAKRVALTLIYGGLATANLVLFGKELYETLDCFSNSCVASISACKVTCSQDKFITHILNDLILAPTLYYTGGTFRDLIQWCWSSESNVGDNV